MSSDLRQRLPVLAFIVIISFTTIYDWAFGLENWRVVPFDLTKAWQAFLGGYGSGETIATLLTSIGVAFLHADAGHIIWNMIFFWIFGVALFEIVGWRWMLAIFLVTTVGATVGQVIKEPYSMVPMVGASGAVSGFKGAYLGLAVQKDRSSTRIWPVHSAISPAQLGAVGVFGIMMDFMNLASSVESNVAFAAHLGGFMTGLGFVFLRRS